MSLPSKSENKAPSRYVDCENCSMQVICQPIGTEKQTIDLTSHYLTKRIEINTEKSTTQHTNKTMGAQLCEQQKLLTTIFAVCSGTFKLTRKNEEGIEKVIGFRFPGELIGDDALYLERYNYTALALENSSVCEIDVEKLSACSKLAPELQLNFIHLLSKQSYQQQCNTQDLVGKKSAESLLAAFILNVCQRNAKSSGNITRFKLNISRHDIACFLGMRRETLSRLLSKLQQEKIIKFNGKQLSILAIDTLQKLANN
jgi:CRP/FNR family transcriptional regulator